MDIEFRKITEFPRGTLAALLKDAYSSSRSSSVIGINNGKSSMTSFMTIPILLSLVDL